MKIKNRMFKIIFILGLVGIFGGCIVIGPRESTYSYTNNIYGIVNNGKVDRMNLPESNTKEMNRIVAKKYGFWFDQGYNSIKAPALYNKGYILNEDFGKSHYIKFYDDIKIVIGDNNFIIPKEKIRLEDSGRGTAYYTYDTPIDVERSNFNNIIVDLGVIEILNKDGEILRAKTKVPALLIKRVYYRVQYRDNFASTPEAVFYNGWAENYPKDDKYLKPIPMK